MYALSFEKNNLKNQNRCSFQSKIQQNRCPKFHFQTEISINSTASSFCLSLLIKQSLQSFPASRSFSMSWLFSLGGQSIGASASASVLPMNIQVWFPLFWLIWSPCSPRDSQESSPELRNFSRTSPEQFESISSSALSPL